MNSKIMQVFFGVDGLPYKDKDRQVHFPIVGSGLIGSSNVNELRFYVRDIGGVNDVAWVVVAKLPNGRQVFQVLSTIVLDTEINEYYLKFPIASAFTQLKGKVYFSLNGYRGNVSISTDSQTNIQTIVVAPGSQQIMTTGTVDISFNYSVVRAQGEELGIDQFTQIMNALADKSNIANTIQVVDSIVNVTVSDYEAGQIFYSLDDKKYWQLYEDENETRFMYLYDNVGSLNKELQLCRYDFSDFLNATVQHIFNDLFHGNYFIAKDGSGNEIICRIRARIGVPPVYDIYGFGVDDDGKLFTKTILNRDSSYTIGAFFVDTYHKTSFVNYINESNILYGNDNINRVIGVLFGTPVYEGFVVQRDAQGQINLPETPVLDKHAASKKYVDDKVKEFGQLSIQEVDITTYPTLNSFLASTGQEGYEYYYPIDTTEAPNFTSGYYRYVWENNAWLSLGTTRVDLSNYVPYTGANKDVDLGNKTLKTIVVYAKASVQFGDSDNNKHAYLTTPPNYSESINWSARLTKRNGSTTPIADLKFPLGTGMLATQEHVSTYYVPYTGATSNVDLGYHFLKANLLSVNESSTEYLTIGSPSISDSVNYSAIFTKRQNNNVACQVKLPIRTGFVAMQEDLDSTNVELNKLKAMFYETTVDIVHYEVETTYEFTLPSAVSYQPVIFSAGADVDYIEGNSFVVNQLANTTNRTYLYYGLTITVTNGNHVSVSGTSTFTSGDTNLYLVYELPNAIQGHKYLTISTSKTFCLFMHSPATTYPLDFYAIDTASGSSAFGLSLRPKTETLIADGTVINEDFDFYFIDLTQMFGSNDLIPQDLLDNPSHFFNYYNGSLAYNEGTIVNSQPTSIITKDSENNVLGTYPITTNVLRSAGSVKDNTQIQKVGAVDLGTLTYGSNTGTFPSNSIYSVSLENVAKANGKVLTSLNGNILIDESSAFVMDPVEGHTFQSPEDVKTQLSGIVLNYELAEPQAQSPSSVVPTDMVIQEGGTCEITYASGNDVPCDMVLKLATSKIGE